MSNNLTINLKKPIVLNAVKRIAKNMCPILDILYSPYDDIKSIRQIKTEYLLNRFLELKKDLLHYKSRSENYSFDTSKNFDIEKRVKAIECKVYSDYIIFLLEDRFGLINARSRYIEFCKEYLEINNIDVDSADVLLVRNMFVKFMNKFLTETDLYDRSISRRASIVEISEEKSDLCRISLPTKKAIVNEMLAYYAIDKLLSSIESDEYDIDSEFYVNLKRTTMTYNHLELINSYVGELVEMYRYRGDSPTVYYLHSISDEPNSDSKIDCDEYARFVACASSEFVKTKVEEAINDDQES